MKARSAMQDISAHKWLPTACPATAPTLWTLATGALSPVVLGRWRTVLDQGERAVLDRLRIPQHRRDCLVAYALRRALLSAVSGSGTLPESWRIGPDRPLGKPCVMAPPDANIDVTLTHTDGLVAAAVTHRGAVGVDAEALDRTPPDAGLLADVLTPAETAALPGPDHPAARTQAFLRLWVAKEATAKALGFGLSLPLGGLAVDPGDTERPATVHLHPPWPDRALALRLLRPTPGHVVALAASDSPAGLPTLHWRHLDAAALDRALAVRKGLPSRAGRGPTPATTEPVP